MDFSMGTCGTPADRRYRWECRLSMGVYVLSVLGLALFKTDHAAGPIWWVAALLPGLALAWQVWAALRLMERTDEFLSALFAKRFLVASGLVMSIATTWGFLEMFVDAPHAPAWLIYPLFWVLLAMISPFISRTHA